MTQDTTRARREFNRETPDGPVHALRDVEALVRAFQLAHEAFEREASHRNEREVERTTAALLAYVPQGDKFSPHFTGAER